MQDKIKNWKIKYNENNNNNIEHTISPNIVIEIFSDTDATTEHDDNSSHSSLSKSSLESSQSS